MSKRGIAFGYKTDTGKMRYGNEDALLLLPEYGIYAVADGVGGQNSGEVASGKAVSGIESFLTANPPDEAEGLKGRERANWLRAYFRRCLQKVNAEIVIEASVNPTMNQMATTIVLCFLKADRLYVVNMGDSRAYMLRDGRMRQLTEDNTYVNKLVKAGTLTKNEARLHPQKNIITKALGSVKNTEPDFYSFDLRTSDRLLLCSDGLHGELTDDEIAEILGQKEDLNTICGMLVDAANAKGGHDNITVICVDGK